MSQKLSDWATNRSTASSTSAATSCSEVTAFSWPESSSQTTSGINTDSNADAPHDDMIADVIRFTHALTGYSRLLTTDQYEPLVVSEGTECRSFERFLSSAHSTLKIALQLLHDLLDRQSALRCPSVLHCAAHLVTVVRESNASNETEVLSLLQEALSALALTVWDQALVHVFPQMSVQDLQSPDDFPDCPSDSGLRAPSWSHNGHLPAPQRRASLPGGVDTEHIDTILQLLPHGLDVAFEHLKAWTKYSKDLIGYVQKRLTLETKHAQDIKKLGDGLEEAFPGEALPLKQHYLRAISADNAFLDTCSAHLRQLIDYKFIKPLELRREQHERKRREVKDRWLREQRDYDDLETELRRARQQYEHSENSYERARDNSLKLELKLEGAATAAGEQQRSKIEKKRRLEEEAMLRKEQALQNARSLEARMENKKRELAQCKAAVLKECRELIYQCDQTTKACTATYFQALATLWAPISMQYHALGEHVRQYIPGSEYHASVCQAAAGWSSATMGESCHCDDLRPQATSADEAFAVPPNDPKSVASLAKSMLQMMGPIGGAPCPPSDMPDGGMYSNNNSALSAEDVSSPKRLVSKKGGKRWLSRRHTISSNAASTHRLEKSTVPARCDHCENYAFVNIMHCSNCNGVWHKECLHHIRPCNPVSPREKMCIFGASLDDYLRLTGASIPPVLISCVTELNKRGTKVKGLYRICAVRSKVDNLCTQFENGDPDLTDVHPAVIASVVKQYLRQLPEPLLSFQHYSDFINLGKELTAMEDSPDESEQLECQQKAALEKCISLVKQLPQSYSDTLAFVIHHLRGMTMLDYENQMNSYNLGIVFGPTLMWRRDDAALRNSNCAFEESPFQAKIITFLIDYAYNIFDIDPFTLWDYAFKFTDEPDEEHVRKYSTNSVPGVACDSPDSSSPEHHSNTPDLLKIPNRHMLQHGQPSPSGSSTGQSVSSSVETGTAASTEVEDHADGGSTIMAASEQRVDSANGRRQQTPSERTGDVGLLEQAKKASSMAKSLLSKQKSLADRPFVTTIHISSTLNLDDKTPSSGGRVVLRPQISSSVYDQVLAGNAPGADKSSYMDSVGLLFGSSEDVKDPSSP